MLAIGFSNLGMHSHVYSATLFSLFLHKHVLPTLNRNIKKESVSTES